MRHSRCGFALLCLTTVLTAAPAEAACGRAKAERAGTWFTSKPPLKPRPVARQALVGNDAVVRAIAVDPGNRLGLFVTDGEHLLRSNDGGCSWQQVYALPDTPGLTTPDGAAGDIVSMDVARVGGKTRVLLAVRGTMSQLPVHLRTVVVRSEDGYTGWTPVVDPVTFASGNAPWQPVIRSAGPIAYVAFPSLNGEATYARSADGGKTWTVRTPADDEPVPKSVSGFAVNPARPDELWDWNTLPYGSDARETGLRRSTDGGRSWVALDPWPAYAAEHKPGFSSAEVAWPRRGGPARVMVLGEAESKDSHNPVAGWSGDGGRTFQQVVPPLRTIPLVDAAASHFPNGDVVLMNRYKQGFRIPHRGRPPTRAEWQWLPKLSGDIGTAHIKDSVQAAGSRPGVVAVAGLLHVHLLMVAR